MRHNSPTVSSVIRVAVPSGLGASVVLGLGVLYYFGVPILQTVEPSEVDFERGKILWASASLLLNFTMLFGLCVAGPIVWQGFGALRLSRRGRFVVGAIALVALACSAWATLYVTFSQTSSVILCALAREGGVLLFLWANNFLATLSVVLFLATSWFIAEGLGSCDAVGLGERLRWFKHSLYSAAALLAAGVYQLFQVFQWAGKRNYYLPDEKLMPYISSVTVGCGIVFSCFLAIIFVPPAISINSHIERLMRLAAANESRFEKSRWLLASNLDVSPSQLIGRYLAVFSPVLVGLLSNFIKSNVGL